MIYFTQRVKGALPPDSTTTDYKIMGDFTQEFTLIENKP